MGFELKFRRVVLGFNLIVLASLGKILVIDLFVLIILMVILSPSPKIENAAWALVIVTHLF